MRAVEAVSGLCGVLAASMILVAVLLTCQMIWVRYVANASTVWQTETVIYLMIGATLLGLPWVQRVRGHVSVDLLPALLPPPARRALAIATLLAVLAVVGVMLYHAAELWYVAWSRGWNSDTVWGPPLWIPYLAMPLGFGLYALQLASDLVGVASGIEEPPAGGGAHGAEPGAALERELVSEPSSAPRTAPPAGSAGGPRTEPREGPPGGDTELPSNAPGGER